MSIDTAIPTTDEFNLGVRTIAPGRSTRQHWVVAGPVVLDFDIRYRPGRSSPRDGGGLKPLIYGYMRLDPEAPDNDIRQMEIALRYYAETKGYCFATTFYEDLSHDGSDRSAFAELIEELQRSEARHVIVPTADHFSAHPLLRTSMLLQLENEALAQVHTLSTTQPPSDGQGHHLDMGRLDRVHENHVVFSEREDGPVGAPTHASTAQPPNRRRCRLVGLPTDAPSSLRRATEPGATAG